MEKICIVKLRKNMTGPAGLEEGFGHGNNTRENTMFQGLSHPVPGSQGLQDAREDGESGDGSTKAAERVVSLKLTREQMRALRSDPSLASALSEEAAVKGTTVHHAGESVVIKFEFDSLPPVRLLKAEEVVHMLRISAGYLKRAIKHGDLKSYKFGRLRRFMLDDILSYLEAHQEITDVEEQAPQSRICRKEIV